MILTSASISGVKVTVLKKTHGNRLFFISALIGSSIWLLLQISCLIHGIVKKLPEEIQPILEQKWTTSKKPDGFESKNETEKNLLKKEFFSPAFLHNKWSLTQQYCQHASWMCIIGVVITCILSTNSSEKKSSHILFLSTALLLVGLVSLYSFLVYKAAYQPILSEVGDHYRTLSNKFFRYFAGLIGFLSVVCSALVVTFFAFIFAKKE